MSITKEALSILRKRMPRGYLRATQDLLETGGTKVTTSSINQVMMGYFQSEVILNALMEVAEDYETKVRAMSIRARGKRRRTTPAKS